jgi:hypothetical protein
LIAAQNGQGAIARDRLTGADLAAYQPQLPFCTRPALPERKAKPKYDARPGRDKLELTAIAGRAFDRTSGFRPCFKCHSYLFGAHQGPADISIFRRAVKRNQPIAVLAVGLESVADPLRPLSKYLRALRAFDFHFFFDHECTRLNVGSLRCAGLRTGIRIC